MTATRTVSRFVIALCPATPIYLAAPSREPKGAITRVKDDACRFETFDDALDVAKKVKGWPGWRVEEIAVEVEDTRVTLDTPEARIEVRDAATCAWNECADCDCVTVHARHTEDYLRSIGLKVGSDVRAGASCPATLYLADHLGNLLTLEWDPMQDGFSYETEGDDACDIGETEAQHEAEPDTVTDSDLRTTAVAIILNSDLCDADRDLVLRALGGGDTVTCDGCGATDAEPCGDSDGHAFCAACRAKSQDAPKAAHAVDFDPAFLDSVLGRDDLTFDQTPLTPEQAKRARATLTASLMMLVLDHLPRLASSALVEAREIETADEREQAPSL